jgi:hypothetical protein
MLFAVGEDKELVSRVEVYEGPHAFLSSPNLTPPLQGKNTLDKVLPEPRIVEAAFLFYGGEGEMVHEDPSEHPNALLFRHAPVVVDLNPLHAAAGGITLENEPANLFSFKILDAGSGPGHHAVCVIHMGADRNQTGRFGVTHKAHRFPRNSQSAFYLRTHGHKLDVLTQGVRDEPIVLVSTVKTDILSQEAGADAEFDPLCHTSPFSGRDALS